MSILDFSRKKTAGQKLSVVTCYDYSFAKILNKSSIDAILVGDSIAMVIYGFNDTLSATTEMMACHTAAVNRGAPDKFIISDMPFLSYRKSLRDTMNSAEELMRAGAKAIKLEGVDGNEQGIEHLVKSGIPVMGHLGLTPQSVYQLGGYKVQGRDESGAKKLVEDAKRLQELGCFSLVLECVPSALASIITDQLEIPTIGIGAGAETSGQVLVLQDLLGMNMDFKPKFVREFLEGDDQILEAINAYHREVTARSFPSSAESYAN